jgi:hypothetical protein
MKIGLTKPVIVQAYDLGNFLAPSVDYFQNILADENFNLVIWSLNPPFFYRVIDGTWIFRNPELTPSDFARFQTEIDRGTRILLGSGKSVVVAFHPLGFSFSPVESEPYRLASSDGAPAELREPLRVPSFGFEEAMTIGRFIDGLSVPHYNAVGAFLREEQVGHPPLHVLLESDGHFAPAGNEFYGDLLAEYLMKIRPWAAKPKAGGPPK